MGLLPHLPWFVRQFGRLTLVTFHRCLNWLHRRSLPWRVTQFEAATTGPLLTSHPDENYLVRPGDLIIGKNLYAHGEFDLLNLERSVAVLESVGSAFSRSQERLLIDVGANLGSICIPAVRRGFVQRSIAIEPEPRNYRFLQINLLLNETEDRVTTHKIGLGRRSEKLWLKRSQDNHGDHRVVQVDAQDSQEDCVPIQIETLDELLGDFDYRHTLLWMDVQGAEGDVLSGASIALAQRVPIVLEFTPADLRDNGTFEELVETLIGNGYEQLVVLSWPDLELRPLTRELFLELESGLENDQHLDILVFSS